jgi:hypothetical protein
MSMDSFWIIAAFILLLLLANGPSSERMREYDITHSSACYKSGYNTVC